MIQTSFSSVSYAGNASIVTPYPVPYYFFTDEDLVVVVKDALGIEELQILGTDYTVAGEGNPNGGSITMKWSIPADHSVTITRDVDATQLTSYEEADAFPAKSHERALDKLTMLVQQALRLTGGSSPTDLGAAFRVSEASSGINAVAKINDTTLCIDGFGSAILRTAEEMLSWLGEAGTVWQDTPERLVTRPTYKGQLGVQINTHTIYIANSVTPGDWIPSLPGTGIVTVVNGVPVMIPAPAGDLVGTEASQVLHNKTLESPTINNPTGLDKNDVGLGNVDNTSDLNKPLSVATGAALAFKEDRAEKGIVGGYASLDGGGKVPIAQIPDALIGASQYQGTWNATTNSPTIPAAAAGNKGWYYSVSVAGSSNPPGTSLAPWAVGDQVISNGAAWQKIPNVSAVQSVNGKTGTVVVNQTDVGLSNVDNTSDATKNAAPAILTNKTIVGANQTLMQVRLDADVVNNLPVSRLNNGTGAGPNTWWCGDQSWKQPPGTGDVNGPAGAGDGELCLYSGTTGKIIRRFSGTAGFAKAGTTGILTTQVKILAADVDKDVITSAPRITVPEWNDLLWISETSDTGLLKSITYHDANPLPQNYLAGMRLSNNVSDTANDIDITAGVARSDDNLGNIVIPSLLTKRLDALWTAGTNQGGRDTGSIVDTGWHIYAIRNPTTNVSDVLFTAASPPAIPTMPSGFTQKRRIGWILRWGAGGIVPFVQRGNYFQYSTPRLDLNAITHTPAQFGNYALASIPYGLKLQCHLALRVANNSGACVVEARDADQGSVGVGSLFGTATNNPNGYVCNLWCDAARQLTIYTLSAPGSSVTTYYVTVLGYWDHRGKED